MTDDELKAIEARANEATPGPWSYDPAEAAEAFDDGPCPHGTEWTGHGPTIRSNMIDDSGYPATVIDGYGYDAWGVDIGKADLEFISHAREDITALIAEIRRLKASA